MSSGEPSVDLTAHASSSWVISKRADDAYIVGPLYIIAESKKKSTSSATLSEWVGDKSNFTNVTIPADWVANGFVITSTGNWTIQSQYSTNYANRHGSVDGCSFVRYEEGGNPASGGQPWYTTYGDQTADTDGDLIIHSNMWPAAQIATKINLAAVLNENYLNGFNKGCELLITDSNKTGIRLIKAVTADTDIGTIKSICWFYEKLNIESTGNSTEGTFDVVAEFSTTGSLSDLNVEKKTTLTLSYGFLDTDDVWKAKVTNSAGKIVLQRSMQSVYNAGYKAACDAISWDTKNYKLSLPAVTSLGVPTTNNTYELTVSTENPSNNGTADTDHIVAHAVIHTLSRYSGQIGSYNKGWKDAADKVTTSDRSKSTIYIYGPASTAGNTKQYGTYSESSSNPRTANATTLTSGASVTTSTASWYTYESAYTSGIYYRTDSGSFTVSRGTSYEARVERDTATMYKYRGSDSTTRLDRFDRETTGSLTYISDVGYSGSSFSWS